MKTWFYVVALLALVILAMPAYAGVYNCTGTITQLQINNAFGGGAVFVSGPGGIFGVPICSLNGSSGSFSADGCKATYAMLLSAKLSGQTVTITFSDNLTCSTQPAWGAPGTTSAWAIYM